MVMSVGMRVRVIVFVVTVIVPFVLVGRVMPMIALVSPVVQLGVQRIIQSAQWCFIKGCGIVPEQRAGDAFHEVASFKSPYASVRSYMLNINRHDAYQELRRIRAEALKNKGFASGTVVAGGLESYSERGHEYIDEVRSMIRFNKLGKYDQPDTSDS